MRLKRERVGFHWDIENGCASYLGLERDDVHVHVDVVVGWELKLEYSIHKSTAL